MYSTKEAADFLKVSVRTLKRWLKNGILKPVTTYDNGYNAYSEEQLKIFQKGMTHSEKNVGTRDTSFQPVTKDVTPLQTGENDKTGENQTRISEMKGTNMINLNAMATPKEIKVIAALSESARADLIARINATDPFNIFDSVPGKEGKEIICPFCGSGSHGNKNTGIKPTEKDGVWLYHCFAGNDCEGALLNIIATANNLFARGKDFFEVLAIASNILGINISSPSDETQFKQPSRKFDNKKSRVLEFVLKQKQTSKLAGNSDSSILSALEKEVNSERIDSDMASDTTVTAATTISKYDLFTTKEVAKIVGVNEKTLRRWNKDKIFEPYLIDHHGDFYYSREEVEQLQAAYQKSKRRNFAYRNVRTMSAGQKVNVRTMSAGQKVNVRTMSAGQKVKEKIKLPEWYSQAQRNLPSFIKNQGGKWRGLSLDTLQKMNCGFLPNVYFPDAKKELPAVVIPNDLNGVYFRATEGKFHKNQSPTATTTIYIPDATNFDLIVTEGQINAASIFQSILDVTGNLPEFAIIAGGGTSGNKHVVDKLQQLKDSGKTFRVLIAYDNDSNNAGQNAADNLSKTLKKTGYTACTTIFIKDPDTDFNDVLKRSNGNSELFDLIQENLAQVTDTAFLDILKKQKSRDTISLNTKNKHGSCNIGTPRKESFTMSDSDCSKQISDSQGVNHQEPEKSIHTQFTRVNHQEMGKSIHTQFTQVKKSKREGFYTAAEVAKILGVDRTTIIYWRKQNLFVEDILDHHGVYLYSKERVEQLKSVYRKDWQRAWAKGDSEVDSDTDSDDMHEVKETDINGETDAFEIEKNRVMKDSLNDSETDKFFIPLPYVVTNHGIKKIGKKDISTICPRPILIKEKYYNLEDNTFKLSLEHLNANKQWKSIPPQPRGNIFNKNKIVELANFGLPVTTGNSAKIVDWIFNFDLANEKFIPLTYTVNRCGWYNYKDNDYFIDPRIKNTVRENGKNIDIVVDSANQMATSLKTKGTLEKWKEAYNLATVSVVARATIAASVAAPLLKILNERNFVYYVFGKTRGGKSTALYLGASAVGSKDMVRVFDGTNNGLISALANTNHYSFFFDEKQAADSKFLAEKQRFIYLAAEGTERSRANKDGTARTVKEWRNIVICNGETELLDDTATGGAHTRLLQIHAQDTILDADTCKQIRNIIKDNYGHAFPLFINQLFKENFDELRQRYEDFQKIFSAFAEDNGGKILPEYAKYISLIFIADQILNDAIGNNIDGLDYGQLLKLIPTLEDIDDAKKEFNSVLGFIAEKAAHFVGSEFYNKDRGLDIYGKSQVSDDFTLLTVSALKKHCGDKSLDYEKVVSDCITHGYFIPDDKIRGNRKSVLNTVVKKISSINYNCFQIPNYFIFGDNN